MSRSASAIAREIRTPSEWIAPAFETLTIVTKEGQRIRGAKKAEDVFTVQIMDTSERIQGYRKSDLREVVYETTSLMPVYPPERLSDSDLTDLVGYLSTQLGEAGTPRPAAAAASTAPISNRDLLDGLKYLLVPAGSMLTAFTLPADRTR